MPRLARNMDFDDAVLDELALSVVPTPAKARAPRQLTTKGTQDKKKSKAGKQKKGAVAAPRCVPRVMKEKIKKHCAKRSAAAASYATTLLEKARKVQVHLSSDARPTELLSAFTLASDCAGMGTDSIAARKEGLHVETVWASESDRSVRKLLRTAIGNTKIYHDLTKRDNSKAVRPDMIVAGPHCQPWSSAGGSHVTLTLENWVGNRPVLGGYR